MPKHIEMEMYKTKADLVADLEGNTPPCKAGVKTSRRHPQPNDLEGEQVYYMSRVKRNTRYMHHFQTRLSELPLLLQSKKVNFVHRIRQRSRKETTPISLIYKQEVARDSDAGMLISEEYAKRKMQWVRRSKFQLCKYKESHSIKKECPENYDGDEDSQVNLKLSPVEYEKLDSIKNEHSENDENSQENHSFPVNESCVDRPAEKVSGFRENSTLYHDGAGYFYLSNRCVDNVIYLQCSVRNCRVRASITMEENALIKLSQNSPLHSHRPDFLRLRLTAFMKTATGRAISDLSTSIAEIYNQQSDKDPKGAACISAENAKLRLSRARRKHLNNMKLRRSRKPFGYEEFIYNDQEVTSEIEDSTTSPQTRVAESRLKSDECVPLPAQKVPGSRHHSTLFHDGRGYFYTSYKTRGDTLYMQCTVRSCRVRASMKKEQNAPITLSQNSPLHNHNPDFKRLCLSAFLEKVRERALNEESDINDIYREEAEKDPEGAAVLPAGHVKQRLAKMRKRYCIRKNPSPNADLSTSRYSKLTTTSRRAEYTCSKSSEKVPSFKKDSTVYHDGCGYFYRANKTRGSITYLQCCVTSCRVRASVNGKENAPVKLSATSPSHNHGPDFFRIARTMFMKRANHRAATENTPIPEIYAEEASKDPKGAAAISAVKAKQRMFKARQLLKDLPNPVQDERQDEIESEDECYILII